MSGDVVSSDVLSVANSVHETITREQLYEMVWKEPMLRVAVRFGVSGSYMARVCTQLRVPRPVPGHWTKLECGKESVQVPLPAALPGDVTVWSRAENGPSAQSMVVRAAAPGKPRSQTSHAMKLVSDSKHELLIGVRPHFIKSRASDTGLLRPYKRFLVDIVVSEVLLDRTLEVANVLFQALVARGHRVVLAPPDSRMRRTELDEREVPVRNRYRQPVWAPDRATVVYIRGVPIGLTLLEMTEEVEVIYDNGNHLPVRTLTPAQQKRLKGPHHWTTKKSYPSKRLCLQAYCPHWDVSWTKQWREQKEGLFPLLVNDIVQELEDASPEIAQRVEDAELRAKAQRKKWEEERESERIEAENARRAKALAEAKHDILSAIKAWDDARRIYAYFDAAEREANCLEEQMRSTVLDRLSKAKELIGPVDALDVLRTWKGPEER